MTDMIAKEGVEAETVEAVKSLSGKYKYGFSTDILSLIHISEHTRPY